ncbi:MAG: ArsR family transcriptional regulator [Anaerolineae bacterium]|nr:ArsR family transcriptional regulator [Anaerolineae bacterium]
MIKPTNHPTRQAIIEALKAVGQATVGQLTQMVGVKAVTVRHHLHVLLAEGLIEQKEKRQTVGRPLHTYGLTSQGENLFPHQYHRLVERLLDQVKENLPPETVRTLLSSLATALVEGRQQELGKGTIAERMNRLVAILAQEGFLAEWEWSDQELRLIGYHCPYYFVGQYHPEICQIGETMIRLAMGAEVDKETCLLDGDPACRFILRDYPDVVSL